MHQIDYHEPEFVRHYLSQDDANQEQVVSLRWLQEIRQSLLLTTTASCNALLQKPDAFTLHSEKREVSEEAAELPRRAQVLNQASFDIMTLHPLPMDMRLYCLGVMLSFSGKFSADNDETLNVLSGLPQKMREYLEQGVIEQQFNQLPAVPTLQRSLISALASMDFNWDLLPDSVRKSTLPMQISLLALQDENGEAMLQQQLSTLWQTSASACFDETPWMLENYMLYRLYHDVFPLHQDQSVMESYLALNCDFFILRTLFSLWVMDESTLSADEIVALVAMFEQWRHTSAAGQHYQQLLTSLPGDALLSAFSLLIP